MGPPEDDGLCLLDRRVVPYWFITGVFGALILCAVLAGGALFVNYKWEHLGPLAVTGAAVLGGVNLLWAVISPWLAYARWRYRSDDELLYMRYGIIFHEERAIPVNRMQHVDLTRGPIERLFGLASLVVFTAGNEGSAFRVPGMAVADAQVLRDRILSARGDDVI